MEQFRELLNNIASNQTFRETGEQAKTLLEICAQLPDDQKIECLKAFLDIVLKESFNAVSARQYLNEFNSAVSGFSADVQKKIIPYAVDKIQPRSITFEEQIFALRERLAVELEKDQDWIGAARVLSLIPLESGQRQYDANVRVDKYLKIAMLFLEAGEFTEAEPYIHRIGPLLDKDTPEQLRIMYSEPFARIQDFKRKYIEAAQRYYELSKNTFISEIDRKTALERAVNCVILAPITPQRLRFMAALIKDERILQLSTCGFLLKIFDGKTIKRNEMEKFAEQLQPYQREALTPDGTKLLEQILLEHNILSTRKYFRVASFEALSRLLDIQPIRLEKIIANMVAENRLKVKINHENKSVAFEQEHPLNNWDKKLEQICAQVNKTVDLMEARYPQWFASINPPK